MKPIKRLKRFERKFQWWQKNFGIVVRELRLKAKLSQRELAKRANLSMSTLVSIEKGNANPMLNSMENLAIALGTRLSHLFKLTQDRERL
jgi:transcriptional regulator with XRE-family HTH domain